MAPGISPSTPVGQSGLSPMVYTHLQRAGYKTLGSLCDLVHKSGPKALAYIDRVNKEQSREILALLQDNNLL